MSQQGVWEGLCVIILQNTLYCENLCSTTASKHLNCVNWGKNWGSNVMVPFSSSQSELNTAPLTWLNQKKKSRSRDREKEQNRREQRI